MIGLTTREPFWTQQHVGYQGVKQVATELKNTLHLSGRYNVTLLNDNREYRAMKYRYFFDTAQIAPQSQYDYTNLEQLIVFVENGEDPQKAPIYEIEQFFRENKKAHLVTTQNYPGIVQVYVFGK
jgi:hypothetical protein